MSQIKPLRANNGERGDFVVCSIIDAMIEVTGYGPEALDPDYTLGSDFDLDEEQIDRLAVSLSRILGIGINAKLSREDSLRNIEQMIKKTAVKAAA